MLLRSWRLARIFGIEVSIDPSWVFIAVLIGWNFYRRFDFLYPDLGWGGLLGLAIGAALVFFGSVLAHELAHSLTFVRRGVEVEGITLFLFGGATRTSTEAETPEDEIAGTAVGPATSAVIAGVLGAVALGLGDTADDPVAGAIGYLAWLNLFLAVFNLLPGLPLDGGRLLRGIVWRSTGDVVRATRVAARAGRAIGYGIIGFGILLLLAGGFLAALWLGAIGWFLAQAADAEYEGFRLRRMLREVPARDVMSRDLVTIPAEVTVDDAIRDYFLRYDHSAFPVAADDGAEGLVTLRRVRRVPEEERPRRTVGELRIPGDELDSVGPEASMTAVLECLADEDVNRVVVQEGGHIVGVITPIDITRWAQRRQALDAPDRDAA